VCPVHSHSLSLSLGLFPLRQGSTQLTSMNTLWVNNRKTIQQQQQWHHQHHQQPAPPTTSNNNHQQSSSNASQGGSYVQANFCARKFINNVHKAQNVALLQADPKGGNFVAMFRVKKRWGVGESKKGSWCREVLLCGFVDCLSHCTGKLFASCCCYCSCCCSVVKSGVLQQ